MKKKCIDCAEYQLKWGMHCLSNLRAGFSCSRIVCIVIEKAISKLEEELRTFYIQNNLFFKDSLYINDKEYELFSI